jgi:hypothetical protein
VGSGAATCPMAPDLASAEVGFGAAMRPMTLDLASRLRWAPALPRVPQLLVGRGPKHKEKPSSLTYAARHACSERMRTSFQGA